MPEPETRRLRAAALVALALILLLGGALALGMGGGDDDTALPAAPGTPVDAPAPDFSVALFDGTRFSLAEHLDGDGRPVLLNLWASWCGPCRAEMPDLSAASRQHPGVLVLGVAVDDSPDAARAFAAEIEVAYPVGADDERGSVDEAFAAPGLPATYLIDGGGRIVRIAYGVLTAGQIEALLAEVG